MSQGSRITAVEPFAEATGAADDQVPDMGQVQSSSAAEDEWWEEPAATSRNWPLLLGAALTMAVVTGWTALFVISNQSAMRASPPLAQWTAWIRDWSGPVLLVAAVWLLAMRNSRREAQRFGETARLLGDESARLETRLSAVNRELSLAREFIGAQARDIEALGRVAVERLSHNANSLAALIHDNGNRIDAIADVSTAALDNMDKLRNQLPVIASSAKDVTNNIGAAGRTAHAHIEELITGFNRLNQFGKASERQVHSLRDLVDTTIGEFGRQADRLGEIAQQRFAALAENSEQQRAELDAREIEALAAIRTRAAALDQELAAARATLDAQEAESLTSLRARLASVRDESGVLTRTLRDTEASALDAWKQAIAGLDEDLRKAIDEVAEIDCKAMEAARSRLRSLLGEAEEVDRRWSERDAVLAAELDSRQADMDARHDQFLDRLTAQMTNFEAASARHRRLQDDLFANIAGHATTLEAQLGTFAQQLGTLSGQGDLAQTRLAARLAEVEARLSTSQAALHQADSAMSGLTDNSVRLLELIQASVQHSQEGLPLALAQGEQRLAGIEGRFAALIQHTADAAAQGEALAAQAEASRSSIADAIGMAGELRDTLTLDQTAQSAVIERLQNAIGALRAESMAAAAHCQGELTAAIEGLNVAARHAVAEIETMSTEAMTALAAKLGSVGGAAMETALRERATEVIAELEQTAAKATGASREAAVQLRDQLGKVNELASNLERRVAHARSRAEEQIDNDFARRVALITETLSSNAIDIARAMDHEVSDTAWAAYLKGDRGIFTRRAVRLLDAPGAKAITQLYESDLAFRDHVNRYIHDFEAMLRELLSTRDGNSLGVTLLSSDMGKLYVALAQAIERLRS